jgi:phosphate acetyltransferase
MARSLLVVPVADHSALARTCLGLLRALDRQGVKVAFVKPVAQPSADGGPDRSAELVAAVTALRPPEPLSTALLEQQLGQGELEVVLEKIVAAWEPVYGGSDVVVIQGLSPAPSRLYASSLNEALARALDADVVLAGYWPADGDAEVLAEQFAIAASGYVAGEQARVVGLRDPRTARCRCRRGGRTAGRPGQAAPRRRRGGAVPSRADVAEDPRSGTSPASSDPA